MIKPELFYSLTPMLFRKLSRTRELALLEKFPFQVPNIESYLYTVIDIFLYF